MKFRKKPVVIEAVQWTGDNFEEISVLGEDVFGPYGRENPFLQIKTLEGVMTANIGDWIISGVKGEIYPCKDEIFKMTYEAVE